MKKLHTESEIISGNSMKIYQLAKLLQTQPEIFYQIAEYLPFVVFQSERESLNWQWGNNFGLDYFEVNQGEAPDLSTLAKKANTEILDYNITKIKHFAKQNDKNAMCSYYQLFEFENKNQWVSSSKIITCDNNFFSISYFLEDFAGFGTYIHEVLDTTFSDINAWKKFQALSKKEKNILQLIAQGKSAKEIAKATFISEHTVRTHRKNIYRKIDVKNLYGLIKFAESFKLLGAL
ncbi:MAG: helix-turn-helix transcriptional regulator [Colwellia sp.]|nr:helix-turn-helix transcriptional regulator [Colwellia sp.]